MMSRNRRKTVAVTVVVAAIVVASLWPLSLAADGGWDESDEMMAGSSAETLERRLESLEKMLGTSRSPISGRIDVLEEGLRDLTTAMGGTGWPSIKSNIREVKKTLDELARHRKQQDEDLRKLRQAGEKLERVGEDLAKVHRAMDEMDRRLRRLESRS